MILHGRSRVQVQCSGEGTEWHALSRSLRICTHAISVFQNEVINDSQLMAVAYLCGQIILYCFAHVYCTFAQLCFPSLSTVYLHFAAECLSKPHW